MFNAKKTFNRLVLAASLSCAAVFAQAEPMKYHVTVNTAGLSGGYFDASIATPTGVSQAFTAALSNFTGAFGAVDPSVSHDYLVTADGFSLSNGVDGSYLSQLATFGGVLSFDVLFSGDFFTAQNGEASKLLFALYGNDGLTQLGAGGFDLAGTGNTRISLAEGSRFITINAAAVPEPGQLLLLLTALGLMGVVVKRRQA